jgi:hypothetical protein
MGMPDAPHWFGLSVQHGPKQRKARSVSAFVRSIDVPLESDALFQDPKTSDCYVGLLGFAQGIVFASNCCVVSCINSKRRLEAVRNGSALGTPDQLQQYVSFPAVFALGDLKRSQFRCGKTSTIWLTAPMGLVEGHELFARKTIAALIALAAIKLRAWCRGHTDERVRSLIDASYTEVCPSAVFEALKQDRRSVQSELSALVCTVLRARSELLFNSFSSAIEHVMAYNV